MAKATKSLAELISSVSVPKNQFNKFGNFHYRNLEDIFEGVRTILGEYGADLAVTDKLISLDGIMVIEATATITLGEKTKTATAYAGIELKKKGMD